MGMGNFKGAKGQSIVKYSNTLPQSVEKRLNRSRCYWVMDSGEPKEACVIWGTDPDTKGLGKGCAWAYPTTLWCKLSKNGWTAVWVVDSSRHKEARVQLHFSGSANVPSWESTLAPPGEYDWSVRMWQRCGLMSNYFFHLLLLWLPCVADADIIFSSCGFFYLLLL